MYLRALQDVPSSVSAIPAGTIFVEEDEFRIQEMILGKIAEPVDQKKKNARGWDGLYWDGMTVVIMASGPSMCEEQAKVVEVWRDHYGDRKVIVVNTTFRLAPWADVLYACDSRWWQVHKSEVEENFKGELWSQDQGAPVHLINSQRNPGLAKQPGIINQGNNGGYQAIGLAYQAGAAKIILLGFDMKGGHWHGDHPPGLNTKPNFSLWINNFAKLAEDLKDIGVEVINCTPKTALPCFKKMELEVVLA